MAPTRAFIFMSTAPEGTTETGRSSNGTGSTHSERRKWINHTRPQGGENPTALPLARPLGNPRRTLHTRWRLITAQLVIAMHNAGSLLNKTEELADLAQQKNLDIIGVTGTQLHDGICDDEICLPGYTRKPVLPSFIHPISSRPPFPEKKEGA